VTVSVFTGLCVLSLTQASAVMDIKEGDVDELNRVHEVDVDGPNLNRLQKTPLEVGVEVDGGSGHPATFHVCTA